MQLSIDVEGITVWNGSSLFFGGLNLARQIRRWRHARLVDYDRYDADCDSESFGWDDDEEAFIELCQDAGETAWHRRNVWEVVYADTGRRYFDARFTKSAAELAAASHSKLETRQLVARRIEF